MSLKSLEWSHGNGQCPACEGIGPGLAFMLSPERLAMHGGAGHKAGCTLYRDLAILDRWAEGRPVRFNGVRGRWVANEA